MGCQADGPGRCRDGAVDGGPQPVSSRPVEFLVAIDIHLPDDLEAGRRDELLQAEYERGTSLARAGILRAVWRVPGKLANRGIWAAPDATALHEALVSLPLWPYMTVEVVPLARHPLAEHCQGIPPGASAQSPTGG